MYQTYFWDFDGTLFDSYAVMAPALVYGFKCQQVEVSKDLAYQLMRQKSRGEAFESLGKQWPQVDLKQAYADYKSYERAHLQSLQPFNGAKEVLAAIVAAGGQNFLLTHRNDEAWQLLAKANLKQYFTGGVSGADNFARKPNPASLNYLCEKYQVNPARAAMVGDRTLDIEAGHNAGMAGILFDPDDLIKDCEPDLRVTNLSAMLA